MAESDPAGWEIGELRTLADFVRWGASRFGEHGLHFGHGTDNAVDEARVLALHALSLDPQLPDALYAGVLTVAERKAVCALLRERVESRKPAPYLMRRAWFGGLEFYVDERVLVPRSPLAELIERGFSPWIEPERVGRVLDVGTGSGALAVGCAVYLPDARIDACDVSADALEVAARNVNRHGLDARVRLLRSDVFDALGDARYDLIVSNPPYVSEASLQNLPAEYSHEPHMALHAEDQGLAVVRRLLAGARRHLHGHGIIAVEVGEASEALIEALPQIPFMWVDLQRGGEGVFILTAEQLDAHAAVLEAL